MRSHEGPLPPPPPPPPLILRYSSTSDLIELISTTKWGTCMSDYFCISNGVRQGRIMSPKLFSVYVDDLSGKLIKRKIGCHIDNLCMNHVMYADNICLSPASTCIQELIDICYDFSIQNNLSFNSTNLYGMMLWPKSYKLSCSVLYMISLELKYADKFKYLGFTFSLDQKDIRDMLCQLRNACIQ